jgi:tetratricopeptide (TPR) repeat protein
LGLLYLSGWALTTAESWYEKGLALSEQSNYDDAIKASDEAIRLGSQGCRCLNNKDLSLDHQGKYDDAIDRYGKAISLDPNYAPPVCGASRSFSS